MSILKVFHHARFFKSEVKKKGGGAGKGLEISYLEVL